MEAQMISKKKILRADEEPSIEDDRDAMILDLACKVAMLEMGV